MRRCLILFFATIYAMSGYSQDWMLKQDDKDYIKWLSEGLREGDAMPDIPLGTILNNTTGNERFSQFKGKLVILDFWNTNCATCISGFPKMEKLQKEFGDSIQVILVNVKETREQIEKRFTNLKLQALKKGDSSNKTYYAPNLPQIVKKSKEEKPELEKWFPARSVPQHVWIDRDQKILIRGGGENTYSEKIKAYLNGQKVYAKRDPNTTIYLTAKNEPYWKLMGYFKETPVKFSSIISEFNNEYFAGGGGAFINDIIDSANKTVRSTYINQDMLALYKNGPFRNFIKNWEDKMVYVANGADYEKYPQFKLLVKDTLRYSSIYKQVKGYVHVKDVEMIKSSFCYEQIVPLSFSNEKRSDNMKKDLDNYFNNLYGTTVTIEREYTPCYILKRISGKDQLSAKIPQDSEYAVEKSEITNGKYIVTNGTLNSTINIIIDSSPKLKAHFDSNRITGKSFFILNETGYNGKNKQIDIALPIGAALNSFDQLRSELQKYGLDMTQEMRQMEFIVVRDK